MGRWLQRFLSEQGFVALALDPAASQEENDRAHAAFQTAELIICSTPPAKTAELYAIWSTRPPSGLVVDIASIKSPLIESIRSLQHSGARVGSVHPVFGPATDLVQGVDVVVCDTSDVEASMKTEQLFSRATFRILHMQLEEHDRVMADLLSMSHAAAIAVALALPSPAHPVSSPAFNALKNLAASVVRESPEVYYEIQVMNPYSAGALRRLRDSVDRVIDAVSARDARGFRALMEEGRKKTEPFGRS